MGDRPKVLARLPDLDITELDRIIDADPPVGGKRPLTQRISTAALIGVGALFVIVALQPYIGKSERGMQPPAPSAPSAPAWDATAAKTSPSSVATQAQSTPSVPVSIPALPSSIPAVPDSIQSPAAPSSNPIGLPVPSFNKHSQTTPASEPRSAPGLAEISSSQAATPAPATPVGVPDTRTAQLIAPPSASPSATYEAPGIGYQPAPIQPGYYAPPAQPMPNQAMSLGANGNPPTSYYPPAAFAGAANTPANLNTYGQSTEPGVARLQGVIEKSTQRPSYDTSRSSLR